MKPEALVGIRRRLKVTQVELADAIGVDARTVSRWETGFTDIPTPVAVLINLIAYLPSAADAVGLRPKEE